MYLGHLSTESNACEGLKDLLLKTSQLPLSESILTSASTLAHLSLCSVCALL